MSPWNDALSSERGTDSDWNEGVDVVASDVLRTVVPWKDVMAS
jgi:hypothetical protein